jgi:hypothetical protein
MILILFTAFFLFPKDLKQDYIHTKISLTIRVSSPELVRREILKFTNEQNGYIASFSNQRIALSFPKRITKEKILNFLNNRGIIVSQNFSSVDYSDQILSLQVSIKVKEQYLQQLNQLTQEASLVQTLEMEQEISKVIQELEELKGNYNYYLELANSMNVEIQFINIEKGSLPKKPYPYWVSKLGIFNFLERFHEK